MINAKHGFFLLESTILYISFIVYKNHLFTHFKDISPNLCSIRARCLLLKSMDYLLSYIEIDCIVLLIILYKSLFLSSFYFERTFFNANSFCVRNVFFIISSWNVLLYHITVYFLSSFVSLLITHILYVNFVYLFNLVTPL